MNEITIHAGLEEGGWLKLKVEGSEDVPKGFGLWLAALEFLIEEADTHLEEKQGDPNAADRLYETVLMAVARHRAVDLHDMGPQKAGDVLRTLVQELAQNDATMGRQKLRERSFAGATEGARRRSKEASGELGAGMNAPTPQDLLLAHCLSLPHAGAGSGPSLLYQLWGTEGYIP